MLLLMMLVLPQNLQPNMLQMNDAWAYHFTEKCSFCPSNLFRCSFIMGYDIMRCHTMDALLFTLRSTSFFSFGFIY